MALEGNGAKVAKEDIDRLKAAAKEATPEAKKAAEAVEAIGKATEKKRPTWKREEAQAGKEVTEELAKQVTVTEQVTEAKEEEVAVNEDLAEGLAELAKNYLGAFAAAAAARGMAAVVGLAATVAVEKFRQIIKDGEEAAERAREVEQAYAQVRPLGNAAQTAQEDAKIIARANADVARSMDTVTGYITRMNAELLLQQRLTQKIEDATLDLKIADINARLGKRDITQSQANLEIANAQAAARARKEERDLKMVQQQAGLQSQAAEQAAARKAAAEAAFMAMGPLVKAQGNAVDRAEADAGLIGKQGPAAIKKLEEERAKWVGQQDSIDAKLISQARKDAAKARLQEEIDRIDGEIAAINGQMLSAKKIEKQESDRLAEMTKERSTLESEIKSYGEQEVQFRAEADRLNREYQALLENRNKVQAIENEAAQKRTEASKAADERNARIRQLEVEIERNKQQQLLNPTNEATRRRGTLLQNELDMIRTRPEDWQLQQERNRTRSIDTEQDIKRDRERRLKNGLSATFDGNAVNEAFGVPDVLDLTKELVASVKGNSAATAREIASLRREVSELATRTETLLAG
jgi:hypothetical protein